MAPQINLYLVELRRSIVSAYNNSKNPFKEPTLIWNLYSVKMGPSTITIMFDNTPLGHINYTAMDKVVNLSILSTAGYERQGSGQLLIALCLLLGQVQECTHVKLGEEDVARNIQTGETSSIWTKLGLSGTKQPIPSVIKRLLLNQAARAAAEPLKVTIDPNALLVPLTPISTGVTTKAASRESPF